MPVSPLKLAIVGAGPSAFYVAGRVLQLMGKAAVAGSGRHTGASTPTAAPLSPNDVRIHIYERLWAPYGLVRYGVAPDHPEVKNCTHKFDITASDPRVRFFGNVRVGGSTIVSTSTSTRASPSLSTSTSSSRTSAFASGALPLPLSTLLPHYTHLVFATGAPTPRTHPLLPRAKGVCVPALDIVWWYTGHPEAGGGGRGDALVMTAAAAPTRIVTSHTSSDGSPRVFTAVPDTFLPIPPNTRHVTLIGHGNVSLDVARLLLTPPSRLTSLSLPPPVLDTLTALWGTIRHISIIGRRGPREAKFGAKELREFGALGVGLGVKEEVLKEAEEGGGELTRKQKRVLGLLREGSNGKDEVGGVRKRLSIDFWRAPVGYNVLEPSNSEEDARARVELELEETRLDGETGRAVGTGRYERVGTDLIVTSLGYEGDATMFEDVSVPGGGSASLPWYDLSRGRIRTQNAGGRVMTPDGAIVPRVYASGWAGRGAEGVLAGTLVDANDVAAAIVEDWEEGGNDRGLLAQGGEVQGGLEDVPGVVAEGVREGRVIDWGQWRALEKKENKMGHRGWLVRQAD